MTQNLGGIIYLFSINNRQKFNRKNKVHIQENLRIDLYLFKILEIKYT